jgi:hypothetical protein
MSLIPLELQMGFKNNGTEFQSSNRWLDGNLVRWHQNSIRPIGGWEVRVSSAFSNPARAMVAWQDLSENRLYAAGTSDKLYAINAGGAVTDITPATLTTGIVDADINDGYGGSFYGNDYYGTERVSNGTYSEATTWSLDNWGEYLVACSVADGKLWEWQLDVASNAAVISNAPTDNLGLLVTEERFLFALGAGGNARKVQWSDREDNTTWTPAATNEAGDIELQTSGQIMAGVRTRGQSLIITDIDAHSATYIGSPYVYGFDRVGTSCGLIARKAVAATDAGVMWMGQKNFFLYDGAKVQEVPCEVWDHVFTNINRAQVSKVWATTVAQHGEVWFFYPSGASTEIDRYVAYDYREGHWLIGSLSRTSGFDRGVFKNSIFSDVSGNVYNHEKGLNYDGGTVFAETGAISIGSGDNVMSVTKLIPDELTQGDVAVTFKTRFHPNDTERSYGSYSMANPTSVRFSGRQIRMRIEGARFADWRVGTMRIDVTARGKR